MILILLKPYVILTFSGVQISLDSDEIIQLFVRLNFIESLLNCEIYQCGRLSRISDAELLLLIAHLM